MNSSHEYEVKEDFTLKSVPTAQEWTLDNKESQVSDQNSNYLEKHLENGQEYFNNHKNQMFL